MAAPGGASGRAGGGAAVVLEWLSPIAPPGFYARASRPASRLVHPTRARTRRARCVPRRRSCRPSLRGCVRASSRAPRAGQGVRPPAAGADAVRGPRSASGSPGAILRPGRDSTPGDGRAPAWPRAGGSRGRRRRDPRPRPRKRPRLPLGGVAQDSHRRFAGSRVPARRISCAVARDIRGLARVRLRERGETASALRRRECVEVARPLDLLGRGDFRRPEIAEAEGDGVEGSDADGSVILRGGDQHPLQTGCPRSASCPHGPVFAGKWWWSRGRRRPVDSLSDSLTS